MAISNTPQTSAIGDTVFLQDNGGGVPTLPAVDGSLLTGVGSGGGRGIATVNFGAFPGVAEASVNVTGQTNILTNSKIMVAIAPIATTEHSADEHVYETMMVRANNVVAGTGFTVVARSDSRVFLTNHSYQNLLYGQFSIAWSWE